ncbi:cupin-like domain-containing protein [Rhodanobacter koreensis]
MHQSVGHLATLPAWRAGATPLNTAAIHPDARAASVQTRVAVERLRADDLPYASFVREYVATNRPVVVENAMRACPAMGKWTPEFFKHQFGAKQVNVSHSQRMTFDAFIDAVLASREDAPGPYMYRLFIGPHLPELLPDLEPQNPYAFPRRLASPLMLRPWRRPDGYLKLLIGGTGGHFPILHYDGENGHATITEIYGDKEFILYPPEDSAYVYPKSGIPNQSLIPDVQHPDPERFPLFAKATQYHTVLRPGDMVFVPSRWWHAARALTPSISICQNMFDASNWSGYVNEICPPVAGLRGLKRMAKKAYLTGLGNILSTLEREPRRHGALAVRIARLAPVSIDDVGDSSTWPVGSWDAN